MASKTIQDQIRELIAQSISSYGEEEKIGLVHPEDSKHGDYSSNIALVLSRKLHKSPMDIGREIVDRLQKLDLPMISNIKNIEVVFPGFINFFLKEEFLLANLEMCTEIEQKKKQHIMVEYTDANPFKEFHIGHLYSNAVGESLSCLLGALGHEVKRVNYFGDVGMHVAKAIWGMQQEVHKNFGGSDDKYVKYINQSPRRGISLLGKAYAHGAIEFENSPEIKRQIQQLNIYIYVAAQNELPKDEKKIDYKKLNEGSLDEALLNEVILLYTAGKKISIQYFTNIYHRLGTIFDIEYPESGCSEKGYELVQEGLTKKIFEHSDGAIIYRGEQDGFHTRVFVNSYGLPTYETKEMGLAYKKFQDFPFDLSISVTGSEINDYFNTVMSAFSKIKPDIAKKTKHIGHGMVRLKTGKMSSRLGNILTGEWLLDEAKKNILEILQKGDKAYEETEMNNIAETSSIAAIKYSLLKVSLPSDIDFDIHESINMEGDSGPYLLYTYARCVSVIDKAQKDISEDSNEATDKERELSRRLMYFSEVVEDAANKYAPNILCTYLYGLSQDFNSFYATSRISGNSHRIKITQCTSKVLLKGLALLGIKTLERM